MELFHVVPSLEQQAVSLPYAKRSYELRGYPNFLCESPASLTPVAGQKFEDQLAKLSRTNGDVRRLGPIFNISNECISQSCPEVASFAPGVFNPVINRPRLFTSNMRETFPGQSLHIIREAVRFYLHAYGRCSLRIPGRTATY